MTAMTAPLSLFLTSFSAPLRQPAAVEVLPPAPEPTVTMSLTELDARIESAAQTARADAESRHAAEIESFVSAHEAALTEAVATARAEWADAAGDRFAELIETRLADLRVTIADQVALVLRPLLSEAARMRTVQALTDAIDRLLGDPAKALIRISGPEDLLEALRKSRSAPGIEWTVTDKPEVTIKSLNTCIETRLAAALDEITAIESDHVR